MFASDKLGASRSYKIRWGDICSICGKGNYNNTVGVDVDDSEKITLVKAPLKTITITLSIIQRNR